MRYLEIAEKSLEAISELDYPDFELVCIDNASTDGSFSVIKEKVEKLKSKIKVKLYRNGENLGFTGGNNVAYRLADKDSKYIVLLNNDAIPLKESLSELIEFLNLDEKIGAVQGIVYSYQNPSKIDTAGDFIIEESLGSMPVRVKPKKPIAISYPDGSYAVLRREALRRSGLIDRLFIDEAFGYFDDNYLGIKLWQNGFKVISVPVDVGLHKRSSSFSASPIGVYYVFRGWKALIESTKNKNTIFRRLFLLEAIFRVLKNNGFRKEYLSAILRGLKEGKKLGELIVEREGYLDLKNVPKIRLLNRFYEYPFFLLKREAFDSRILERHLKEHLI